MWLNKTEGVGQNYSFNSLRVVDLHNRKGEERQLQTLCNKHVMIKYVEKIFRQILPSFKQMNSLKKKNLKDKTPVFQKDDRYPPVKSLSTQ